MPYCTRCLSFPEEYLDADSATCRHCSTSRYTPLGYGLVLLLLFTMPLLFQGIASEGWLRRLVSFKRFVRLAALRASFAAKGKQALGFYQIIAHLHQVYGVRFPPNFEALQRRLDLFNLNIFALPGLHMQCFGLTSFARQLLFRALVPLILIIGSVSYHYVHRQPSKALPFSLWLTFLVFSLVSSPAFQAFNCETFDDRRSYLRADYSLLCTADGYEQSDYTQLKALAVVVILAYPVGIPATYTLLVFTSRRTAMANKLRFLTANYRAPYFFWELLETTKRLLLASFFALPFVERGTLMQLLAALVVQLVFLVLQIYAAPFKRASDNYFALCANVTLLFTLICCVVLEQDELVEATKEVLPVGMYDHFAIHAGTVTALLFVSTLFVLAASLLIFLQAVASVRHLPLLRWRSHERVAEPPPPPTDGWHALISHFWGTGQDQARVIREKLSMMLPGVRLFLDGEQSHMPVGHVALFLAVNSMRCMCAVACHWLLA